MSAEPITCPERSRTKLPLAWAGKASCATAVTSSGYPTPSSRVKNRVETMAARAWASIRRVPGWR